MVLEFLDGETYRNPDADYDIFVLAVAEENDEEVLLAVLWVDKTTFATLGHGELSVSRDDFKDWELVEF